jgi:hypothetical protein
VRKRWEVKSDALSWKEENSPKQEKARSFFRARFQ